MALLLIVVTLLAGVLPQFGTGVDELMYREATARWLEGGPFYLPHQVAGPYEVAYRDVMYPPVTLWLFVPFQVLPVQLWYAIPLAVMAWSLWRLQPAWWGWALMLPILIWPWTLGYVLLGNPAIWAMTALWLGLRIAGLSVFVLLKPVLFPFATIGMHRRTWWVGLGVLLAMCLPFGTMWFDYLAVVTNARGTAYLAANVPLMLVPLIAYAASVELASERAAVFGRLRSARRLTLPRPGRPAPERVRVGE